MQGMLTILGATSLDITCCLFIVPRSDSVTRKAGGAGTASDSDVQEATTPRDQPSLSSHFCRLRGDLNNEDLTTMNPTFPAFSLGLCNYKGALRGGF